MISKRAQEGLDVPALCNHQDLLHEADPYDAVKNPTGCIKLSMADNYLSHDLIEEKFRSLDWGKFETESLLTYPRIGGEISTLECIASFVNDYCRRELEPITADEVGACSDEVALESGWDEAFRNRINRTRLLAELISLPNSD